MPCSIRTSRSPLRILAVALAAIVFFCAVTTLAAAQETTITQEDNGQVLVTSIPPTLYTTDNVVLTWSPSTPPVPTPTFSSGTILRVAEYITTQSTGASGMAATGGATLPSARSCAQLAVAAFLVVACVGGGALAVI